MLRKAKTKKRISIHAAREGGDVLYCIAHKIACFISIHAAREGGDVDCLYSRAEVSNFNPRRP